MMEEREQGLDELMRGSMDLHIHSSPDIRPRKLDDIELAVSARAAGMAGIFIKSHHTPTSARATIAAGLTPGVAVYGGLVLNTMAGGLNPAAVNTELALGAKEIWLPTISAVNHLRFENKNCSDGILLFDANGQPFEKLLEILDMVARADVMLGSGHLSADETEKVFLLAKSRGVHKFVVTHPEINFVSMSVEVQKRLARAGAWFERGFYSVSSPQNLPTVEIARQIQEVGVETTFIVTDSGQDYNAEPPKMFRRFLSELQDCGLSPSDLSLMVKDHPRQLIGA